MKIFILWVALVAGDGSVTITPTPYDSVDECRAWIKTANAITSRGGVVAKAWCTTEDFA